MQRQGIFENFQNFTCFVISFTCFLDKILVFFKIFTKKFQLLYFGDFRKKMNNFREIVEKKYQKKLSKKHGVLKKIKISGKID